jgi:hypothetical protein
MKNLLGVAVLVGLLVMFEVGLLFFPLTYSPHLRERYVPMLTAEDEPKLPFLPFLRTPKTGQQD